MLILAGRPVVDSLAPALEQQIHTFLNAAGRAPRLDVVLVGNDPASQIYVRNKHREATRLGISSQVHSFPDSVDPLQVRALVERLNRDPGVDGILIQRPLPRAFSLSEVSQWILPSKDVDAFHPELLGRLALGFPGLAPCTPQGIVALLAHYGVEVAGKVACVVGRSPIVGKPLCYMLLNANASVIQCHSRTRNLESLTSQADLLFVAAGVPRLIGRDHVRSGAVVVDVGIHRMPDGGLGGDVRMDEISDLAAAASPVPGGVGPLTIFMLMRNVVTAAQARLDTSTDASVRHS
jgi:methylenetetrahydrofolate dehydrogenase (NADP+)/methenyltetrahydrofolate cyclohydrolase